MGEELEEAEDEGGHEPPHDEGGEDPDEERRLADGQPRQRVVVEGEPRPPASPPVIVELGDLSHF
jgi:hypothetical protein